MTSEFRQDLGGEPEKVWVVVPSYNEELTIGTVVQALRACSYSVVVVDDGSALPVADVIDVSGVHVCRHLVNIGQGAALQTGIEYALRHKPKYLVTFDADGQHAVCDISKLLTPLAKEGYDVSLGTRFADGGQAVDIPKVKAFVLKLAIIFTRLTTGLRLTDTHNGFRAFTAEAASRIKICRNRMAHATEILTEIKRNNLRFKEVPVTIVYSEYSLNKGQKTANAFNIIWDSMMEIFHL